MLDLPYVAGTIAFFMLMLGYVAACSRLGRPRDGERTMSVDSWIAK
jgi:hypothetical protein